MDQNSTSSSTWESAAPPPSVATVNARLAQAGLALLQDASPEEWFRLPVPNNNKSSSVVAALRKLAKARGLPIQTHTRKVDDQLYIYLARMA